MFDLNLTRLGPGELRRFLVDDQREAREVAKRIFRAVSAQRSRAFTAALGEVTTILGAPVFADVPDDQGHYPGSYFPHVLRGLRVSPPPYVLDLMLDRTPPADITDRVAGVVLINV